MIYAMLANGFEEIEALTFVDILRRSDIEIKTVSIYDEKDPPMFKDKKIVISTVFFIEIYRFNSLLCQCIMI